MDKLALVQAFHQEMRELAQAHIRLMDAADEAISAGVSEGELEDPQTNAAKAFVVVRSAYFRRADDLCERFNGAGIGNWNEHMVLSGARKILDDDLNCRP